jgi:hypothetical protein
MKQWRDDVDRLLGMAHYLGQVEATVILAPT